MPRPAADVLARAAFRIAAKTLPQRRLLVERNLIRVLGPGIDRVELDRLVRRTFESYGRYWVDSFRLPDLSIEEIDAGVDYAGFERLMGPLRAGTGAIVVLPHLGGWEWAGFWMTMVARWPVTAVVEAVEPPALFEFFAQFRRQLGMNIVPLGPSAAGQVMRALRDGHVVCLLSDRDIEGNGMEVDFFGERTTLPAGPAALALRTGAPIVPMGCYFKKRGISCVVQPPVPVERKAKRLRDDVQRLTQDIAYELEHLIRAAPEQWHLQQPNWASDHEALEQLRAQR